MKTYHRNLVHRSLKFSVSQNNIIWVTTYVQLSNDKKKQRRGA
ncbi:unnamed protein product, partial [Vitis vinifera]|uniref:Uncharacterized protein n=1 Tax=Vitis vinifera TaxID=29760 RepID=D7SIP7_VITVI